MKNLREKIILLIILCVCSLAFLISPNNIFAADVYFKVVPSSTVGDQAAVVEAYIDPESQDLNAVEGRLVFKEQNNAEISSVLIETGGSLLTLWPEAPTYYENEKIISFSGGTPEGFSKEGLLFRMRIFASNPGDVVISWLGASVYLHDGNGTKENISTKSISISLSKGIPNQINPFSSDSQPPSFDSIEVGSDPNLYNGQYFISFYATDDVSGVSKYLVREGGVVTEVLDGIYVLKDQEKKTRVDITVYDNAGNSKSVRAPLGRYFISSDIIILTVFFLILFFIWLYVYKKSFNK